MNLSFLATAHLILFSLALSEPAFALCTTIIKGPVAMSVRQCSVVVPETAFSSQDSKYSFIRDLPPANRKQFMDTYRGILVSGPVIQSQAIRSGISEDKGALLGESILAFIPPGTESCQALKGRKIEVQLSQTCCDGGGDVPCLLNSSYILSQVKISDPKASARLAGASRTPEAQALYTKAKQALVIRDFKAAGRAFEELRSKGQLDGNGQYQLAVVYRELDRCPVALPILEGLHKKFATKDYWTETEQAVRKGSFLYARCLAMGGIAPEAVYVLQGFLVEPNIFRKEILDSLSHRDFGGIRTSKPYMKYKASAEKALAGGR